ncbi:type I polyketide synthase [Streptomyces shenzhenensis]|uniref:type I polyketide synthase n=1 Tax=Streptomyces shenzhenensis TaxID=943815 RepID=UPI001F1A3EF1|nr:polyketide synthase [Streptomyces shenzhenensis]
MSDEARLREYLRKATAALQEERRKAGELGERLAEAERSRGQDPVVVIGMGCRWPGGIDTPEALWRALVEEQDCLSPFPAGRGWDVAGLYDPEPGIPGRCSVREGGFLTDAGSFDAEFFGYSPEESAGTDPQQRLLLETAWEAVESAGIDPSTLSGSPTGVFVGLTPQGYAGTDGGRERPQEGTDYLAVGTLPSAASGRIAYTLGLHGPALTVDTACSSSLSALHLARRSLLSGECSLALAAGVTVMAVPDVFLEHSRLSALARDGRTKPFSAEADGGNWAEGVGVLLLERLSDAERGGHPVLAVVRGTAVGQNGTSNGLAVPNGPGQRRVMARALADAGLSGADVDYVEAHGTGTPLGDVMEAEAMLAVYGRERPPDRPLLFGSVKSNLGHAQSASGMAGIMKAVLALGYGTVPATLNCEPPLETVERSGGVLRPVPAAVPWPRTDRPGRAAVTALGAGGTNGHAVLEAPAHPPWPADPPSGASAGPARDVRALPWLLSAKDPAALRRQARGLLAHLDAHPARWCDADIAYSLAVTRGVFGHRAAVVGADRGQYLAGLRALADGEPSLWVRSGAARTGRTALVCAHPVPAGLPSYDRLPWEWPAFRDAVADLDEALVPYTGGRPLGKLLAASEPEPDAPVAAFALHVAYAWLWQACLAGPVVLLGEGRAGRWAAAHLRGDRTLDAALAGLLGGDEPPDGPAPTGPDSALVRLATAPCAQLDSFAHQLAGAFVAGVRLDREAVFGGPGVRRVPLPTYPFARTHHWYAQPSDRSPEQR